LASRCTVWRTNAGWLWWVRLRNRAGDFWIGCFPERGWQDTDWKQIGLAGVMEARLALAHLRWSEALPDSDEAVEEPLVMSSR
jgi:hypothetical protein